MGDVLSSIESGLQARGFSFDQARGITAGIFAESGGSPTAYNSKYGATGIGQWLGNRKKLLLQKYGPNPTLDNQLDFLTWELRGGDAGGASVLAQSTQGGILKAYITRFMRPAAGADTTGDLTRGSNYLAGAGSGSGRDYLNGVLGTTVGNALSDLMVGTGDVLVAPGEALQKLYDGLSLSEWFQRAGFAILAILLIGIALFMLAGKAADATGVKLPPIVPV